METPVHFRETQTFDQPWLWGLLGLRALADVVRLARGERSVGETAGRLAALGAAALLLGSATLYTEVRDDGVYVKFAPFHRSFQRIPFSDLGDVRATSYSPLRYGGWGIRWRPGSVAYAVSGRRGVRFERTEGTSVLVGTERPGELLAAVRGEMDRTA